MYLILANPSVKIGKLLYLFFTGLLSAATKRGTCLTHTDTCHEQADIKYEDIISVLKQNGQYNSLVWTKISKMSR